MIISVWKNKGISSLSVYEYAKKYFKCGHLGTLDYYAEGILPILTGVTNKYHEKLHETYKTYFFGFILGICTDTLDLTGNIIKVKKPIVKDLKKKLNEFEKKYFNYTFYQLSPEVSSKKINGKVSYNIKDNKDKVRKLSKVMIETIKFYNVSSDSAFGIVKCSKGFYVRSIVETIGNFISELATTTEICRISVGSINIQNSIKIIRNNECTKRKRNKRFGIKN